MSGLVVFYIAFGAFVLGFGVCAMIAFLAIRQVGKDFHKSIGRNL